MFIRFNEVTHPAKHQRREQGGFKGVFWTKLIKAFVSNNYTHMWTKFETLFHLNKIFVGPCSSLVSSLNWRLAFKVTITLLSRKKSIRIRHGLCHSYRKCSMTFIWLDIVFASSPAGKVSSSLKSTKTSVIISYVACSTEILCCVSVSRQHEAHVTYLACDHSGLT
jgi:hypothetical protein